MFSVKRFSCSKVISSYYYSNFNTFLNVNIISVTTAQNLFSNRQNLYLKNVSSLNSQAFCKPYLTKRYEHSELAVNNFYQNVNFEFVTDGDKDLEKKLKVLFMEVEVMRHEGQKVPQQISDENWKELLSLSSLSQRIKLLSFWWRNEKLKMKDKMKKKEVRMKKEALRKELDEKNETDHIVYGFKGSTIFIRIYDSTIDNQLNRKLINAMLFGQELIIDCSYDDHMTPKESSLCAKQLTMLFAVNRIHEDPFHIHFCNVNCESRVFQKLKKIIPTLCDAAFPMNITSKHYLDLFPKEKLVYLTPHCREELECYNPNDVYIIGAMVDKSNNEPLSLAKAKSQGLRVAKFPLDRYLDWNLGSKSLTLDQVLKIMLDLKCTQQWVSALRHVPQRKLKRDSTTSVLLSGKQFETQVNIKRSDIRYNRESLFDFDKQ